MGVRALKEKTLESRARLVLLLIVVVLFLLWLPQLSPVKAQPQRARFYLR
jgi:competence protein ComGC